MYEHTIARINKIISRCINKVNDEIEGVNLDDRKMFGIGYLGKNLHLHPSDKIRKFCVIDNEKTL